MCEDCLSYFFRFFFLICLVDHNAIIHLRKTVSTFDNHLFSTTKNIYDRQRRLNEIWCKRWHRNEKHIPIEGGRERDRAKKKIQNTKANWFPYRYQYVRCGKIIILHQFWFSLHSHNGFHMNSLKFHAQTEKHRLYLSSIQWIILSHFGFSSNQMLNAQVHMYTVQLVCVWWEWWENFVKFWISIIDRRKIQHHGQKALDEGKKIRKT